MKKFGIFIKNNYFAVIMILNTIIFTAGCGFMGPTCKDWVAKIDNETICRSQIDSEYNVIIETYAKMQGMTPEKFQEMINDDSSVKNQPMLIQLRKKNFVSRYVNEYLFYREALKNGVQDNPKVKAMMLYQKKSYISQHFLESSLKKDISVSDEEIEKFYRKNKNKISSLRQLPIGEAFKRVRSYLSEQKKQKALQQKVQEMRDKFKIEINKSVKGKVEEDQKEKIPEKKGGDKKK